MCKTLPASTAGSAEILVECKTTIRGCRIRPSAALWGAEDPQHGSHSVLCKLTSSLRQTAVTCPPCESVRRLVIFLVFVFLSLAGSPPVWPSICVPACISPSLANSQTHYVYSPHSEWCIFWGNIKKTNLRLSSCGTDCFSASPFLTMILMNGSMKNVPWNSILMQFDAGFMKP